MMQHNQDWDVLGRSIQDIVDRAVNSRDYHSLNQTIRQVVVRTVDIGTETIRKAVENVPAGVQNAVSGKHLPVLYGSTKGRTGAAIAKIVGGSMLAGSSCVGFLAMAALYWMYIQVGVFPVALACVALAGGGVLIGSGIGGLRRIRRFKTYLKTLGTRTQCSLEKLARSVGRSVKFVRRELWQMIDEGLFLQGHMDKEQTCLITSDETFRLFEQSRLQLEQRRIQEAAEREKKAAVSRDPQLQDVLDRGNAFVAQIRKCNDDIPGEEISAKIDHMENIVRRIFRRAEEHPEIVPDLKKLMDYYLPMTVKLLNAYADMDAQPVQGENILSSKREIEATLDTLNLAFEKLLDDLFMDTAMDVSSDISVLNTMLAQEGLAEDELTRMRKQQNL